MPFAQRDKDGSIVALHNSPTAEAPEYVSAGDPAVAAFLEMPDSPFPTREFLDTSDQELARVLEDLIEVLLEKGILMFTELPPAAQQKLINRRRARDFLTTDKPVTFGEDDII